MERESRSCLGSVKNGSETHEMKLSMDVYKNRVAEALVANKEEMPGSWDKNIFKFGDHKVRRMFRNWPVNCVLKWNFENAHK